MTPSNDPQLTTLSCNSMLFSERIEDISTFAQRHATCNTSNLLIKSLHFSDDSQSILLLDVLCLSCHILEGVCHLNYTGCIRAPPQSTQKVRSVLHFCMFMIWTTIPKCCEWSVHRSPYILTSVCADILVCVTSWHWLNVSRMDSQKTIWAVWFHCGRTRVEQGRTKMTVEMEQCRYSESVWLIKSIWWHRFASTVILRHVLNNITGMQRLLHWSRTRQQKGELMGQWYNDRT